MTKANNGPNEVLGKTYLLKPIVVTFLILYLRQHKGFLHILFGFFNSSMKNTSLYVPVVHHICLPHAFGSQQLHPLAWSINSEISSCGQLLELAAPMTFQLSSVGLLYQSHFL